MLYGPPFAIFYAVMGLPIALWADRSNRVKIITVCIILWSIMTALCGIAAGFLMLLFFRIGVAIGEAGCTPPANSIIGDYFIPTAIFLDSEHLQYVAQRILDLRKRNGWFVTKPILPGSKMQYR